jgi:DNA-directed RNA polymerase specialized sigma subunit
MVISKLQNLNQRINKSILNFEDDDILQCRTCDVPTKAKNMYSVNMCDSCKSKEIKLGFTKREMGLICELYVGKEMTMREIARKFHVSNYKISRVIQRYQGIGEQPRKMTIIHNTDNDENF